MLFSPNKMLMVPNRSHLGSSWDPGQRGRARHGLGHARSGQPAHALTRRAGVAGCAQRAALLARAPPVPLGAHYCDVYVTALTFGIVAPGALPRQQDLWRRRRMRGTVVGVFHGGGINEAVLVVFCMY